MKIKKATVLAGALGLGALALAGPALATSTPTNVSVGGSTAAASYNLTASAPNTLTFSVQRSTTPLNMTCTSGAVPASPVSTVQGGPGVTNIATLNKVNFSGCTGPGGALTVTTSGAWTLHRTGGTVTSAQTDVVSGHIENITAVVSNTVCEFTVTGQADGTFNEATQTLTINETGFDGDLDVVRSTNPAKACLNQVPTTSVANFGGAFSVTTSGGPVNLVP